MTFLSTDSIRCSICRDSQNSCHFKQHLFTLLTRRSCAMRDFLAVICLGSLSFALTLRNIPFTCSRTKVHMLNSVENIDVGYSIVMKQLKRAIATVVFCPVIISGAALSLPGPAMTQSAHAGFFASADETALSTIASYRKPVAELLNQLTPLDVPNAVGVFIKQQVLKGGKEDSDVVLNYLEKYIQPLQADMANSVPLITGSGKITDDKAKERLATLPLLMKGHILELRDAIEKQSAESQRREVEEVQETLDEFLSLVVASGAYSVPPAPQAGVRVGTDAELFGPFGCGFYGKGRVPGSNKCAE